MEKMGNLVELHQMDDSTGFLRRHRCGALAFWGCAVF
jgi:hypothetical protein